MKKTLPLDLLTEQGNIDPVMVNKENAEKTMQSINEIFENFRVPARCDSFTIGSSITRYNVFYKSDVQIKTFIRLIDDISIRLGNTPVRFTTNNDGKCEFGLEIPNEIVTTSSFKEAFKSLPDEEKHPLAIILGQNVDGEFKKIDLNDTPHMLVAGTTGSGKSIFLHSVIATLIARNNSEDLKLVLFDPKKVELNKYRELPHLLCPIANDAKSANATLTKLVDEMNKRYELLDENNASNIQEYRELAKQNASLEKMPYIVVIIDEYADLVDGNKNVAKPLVMLLQKARAAGIHIIVSTQRPSTNVITGVIKGNLPTRIAFAVASAVDSMVLLGEGGAEKLLGRGDMLVQSPLLSRIKCIRLQAPFISSQDVNAIVNFCKGNVENVEAGPKKDAEEEKYQEIKSWVMTQEYMSMSRIQRECGGVGFNRAGRIFRRLVNEGVIANEATGKKGCLVLKKATESDEKHRYNDLLSKAKDARALSYSRYSHFAVGAAVLMKDGQVFLGANIENSSYPLCMCGERNAIYNAMMHGYKKEDFVALAICADTDQPVSPCGACRQVIHELFPLHAPILLTNLKGDVKETCAEELLPFAFTGDDLK